MIRRTSRRKLWRLKSLSMRLFCLFSILVSLSHQETTPSVKNQTESTVEWSSCYAELGCLNTTEEWYHPIYRPENPRPNKRHTVKTIFIMHRRGTKKGGEIFTATPASIRSVGFNKADGTTILIHDFTSSGQTGWIEHLAEGVLKQGEQNVIAVDWETGALPPYVQAVSNARLVALEIELLLRWLASNFTVDPSTVRIIGHGLGAHIAGYVGATVHGLARITGLDPSGPYFEKMPPRVRLDASDATFVDVVHTDMPSRDDDEDPGSADGQGIREPSGHVDFYPNGGRDQPGCVKEAMHLLDVTRDSVAPGAVLSDCSHKRAFKYFIESLSSGGCTFLAYRCADYEAFREGKCFSCGPGGSNCSVMGQAAEHYLPTPGRFYVQTAPVAPFCTFLYRVELQLAKPDSAKWKVAGVLLLSLVGNTGPPITMPISKKMVMKHGETQHLIAFHEPPYLGPVAKAQLSWRYELSITNPSTICLFCDDSLYVAKLVITSPPLSPGQSETTVPLCSCDGAQYAEIKSNFSRVFTPCLQDTSIGTMNINETTFIL